MWPGSPIGRAGRSSIEALGFSCDPGTTTEDRPWALGAGGYGMSVWLFSYFLAARAGRGSAADAETLPDRTVAGDVLLGQVLQQPAAAADQQQQPAAAVVVMLVHLQVLGQVVDPPGQQRDLDFRRTGVTLSSRVLRQDLFLDGGVERHVAP